MRIDEFSHFFLLISLFNLNMHQMRRMRRIKYDKLINFASFALFLLTEFPWRLPFFLEKERAICDAAGNDRCFFYWSEAMTCTRLSLHSVARNGPVFSGTLGDLKKTVASKGSDKASSLPSPVPVPVEPIFSGTVAQLKATFPSREERIWQFCASSQSHLLTVLDWVHPGSKRLLAPMTLLGNPHFSSYKKSMNTCRNIQRRVKEGADNLVFKVKMLPDEACSWAKKNITVERACEEVIDSLKKGPQLPGAGGLIYSWYRGAPIYEVNPVMYVAYAVTDIWCLVLETW